MVGIFQNLQKRSVLASFRMGNLEKDLFSSVVIIKRKKLEKIKGAEILYAADLDNIPTTTTYR